MDKEREGRLKAKQCLSPSESFMESFLYELEISYETTLEAYSNYLILYCLKTYFSIIAIKTTANPADLSKESWVIFF